MNKQKWIDIVSEEVKNINVINLVEPSEWKANRIILEKFIKNVEEATEVYGMENNEVV